LFLFALVEGNWNPSAACGKVGISKQTLETWCRTDNGFADLMDEIVWHKKNWAESALMQLVDRGDSPATVFVNKTLNADRGYNVKQTVEHTGVVNHEHVVISVEELDLPLEIKRLVLEAYRRHTRGGEPLPALPGTVTPGGTPYVPETVDSEFEEVETVEEVL
jgi:hypothetical protein